MTRTHIRHIAAAIVLIGGLGFLVYGSPAFGQTVPDPGRSQIRAFIYHHFGMEDKYPSTSVSVEQFRQHLAYFKENAYTVLTLGAALKRMSSGQPLPEKTAVITIDDGYASIWENALPLLEKYGYKATIFVPTSHVGGGNYLSWQQIARLQEKGHEIGNHSHSHAYFVNAAPGKIVERFEADLKKANELFRRHLGAVPELYAYPFGEYHPGMFEVLSRYGYRAAAAQKSGVIYPGSQEYALPRFPMNLHYADMDGFSSKIGMKALQTVSAEPQSPLLKGQNPPELRLRVENPRINPSGLQCFVSGQENCLLEYTRKDGSLLIRVRSRDRLASRRTLYTITAPSAEGNEWFWYSHLWILPDVKE